MTKIESIRHIWFDFNDTLAAIDKAVFEELVYSAYADAVGKPVTPELIAEYKDLLKTHKSNAATFVSLGLPSTFLSDQANSRSGLYHLTDARIPEVLKRLHEVMPISVFSNTRLDTILPELGIESSWFAHILGPDMIKNPKPALDGFYKMIELSGIPGREILYIADDMEKDILPAKQAGMQAALLWKQAPEADYCFDNFSEILASFE